MHPCTHNMMYQCIGTRGMLWCQGLNSKCIKIIRGVSSCTPSQCTVLLPTMVAMGWLVGESRGSMVHFQCLIAVAQLSALPGGLLGVGCGYACTIGLCMVILSLMHNPCITTDRSTCSCLSCSSWRSSCSCARCSMASWYLRLACVCFLVEKALGRGVRGAAQYVFVYP